VQTNPESVSIGFDIYRALLHLIEGLRNATANQASSHFILSY